MCVSRIYNERSKYEGQIKKGTDRRSDRLMKNESIWEKMAEKDMIERLIDMGESMEAIEKYQKTRVMQTAVSFVIFLVMGLFLGETIILALAAIVPFMVYRSRYTTVIKMHKQWKFDREFNFSKFVRLLIPYLKAGKDPALYMVFSKILDRLDNEEDRRSLFILMGEMTDRPGDIQPFNDFAERSSGSDMAYLIMATVYDFQQSTRDTDVINELGQMASEQMMTAINEIIAFKLKRFAMFPTKVVLSAFILVMGYAAGVFLQSFAQMGGFGL